MTINGCASGRRLQKYDLNHQFAWENSRTFYGHFQWLCSSLLEGMTITQWPCIDGTTIKSKNTTGLIDVQHYRKQETDGFSGIDKLEVPTIYCLGNFLGLDFWEYPHKIWPTIWYTTSILGS